MTGTGNEILLRVDQVLHAVCQSCLRHYLHESGRAAVRHRVDGELGFLINDCGEHPPVPAQILRILSEKPVIWAHLFCCHALFCPLVRVVGAEVLVVQFGICLGFLCMAHPDVKSPVLVEVCIMQYPCGVAVEFSCVRHIQ